MQKSWFGKLFLIATAILGVCGAAEATERSLIFPTPREITQSGSDFVLNEEAVIAIPVFPSEEDLFLAQSLANDLGDRFAFHLKTRETQPWKITIGEVELGPTLRARPSSLDQNDGSLLTRLRR